jgi:hypothetical protein
MGVQAGKDAHWPVEGQVSDNRSFRSCFDDGPSNPANSSKSAAAATPIVGAECKKNQITMANPVW